MEPVAIILLGSQGSGKGTQARLLLDTIPTTDTQTVLNCESGAIFREIIQEGGYTAELLKQKMDNGEILPDFFPVWMWTDVFIAKLNQQDHVILDGFPRTVPQAQLLNETLSFYERKDVRVINLDIKKEVAEKRLLARGRSDDTAEGIQKRLAWYEKEVEPVIDFYKNYKDATYIHIDGEQSVEDVHRDIVQALNLE